MFDPDFLTKRFRKRRDPPRHHVTGKPALMAVHADDEAALADHVPLPLKTGTFEQFRRAA